jgi:type II secretion system protein N
MRRVIMPILGYLLFAIVVFSGYLYWTFPYDLLRQRLGDRLAQRGVLLSIARLRPVLPLGLQAQDVRLRLESLANDKAVAQLATLRAQPDWRALLSGKLQMQFDAALYRGQLQGSARWITQDAGKGWNIQATFKDLDIAQHPLVQRDDQAFLRGRGDGEVKLTLDEQGSTQAGSVNLSLQSVAFAGQMLQLPLQRELACNTMKGSLTFDAQQASNVTLTCSGDDLAIESKGTVKWQRPLGRSQLNLNWQLRSETAYKQELDLLSSMVRPRSPRRGELSFRLHGALQQPRFGS